MKKLISTRTAVRLVAAAACVFSFIAPGSGQALMQHAPDDSARALAAVGTALESGASGAQINRLVQGQPELVRRDIVDGLGSQLRKGQRGPARQAAVSTLMTLTGDGSELVRDFAVRTLLKQGDVVRTADFSTDTISQIGNLLSEQPERPAILLAGLTGDPALLARIQPIAGGDAEPPVAGKAYGTSRWAALLALARNGNPEASNELLRSTSELSAFDRVVFGLAELSYAPTAATIAFVGAELLSDDRLEPIDGTEEGPPHAAYAAAALARMVGNFPVEFRADYSYSEAEIEACRAWFRAAQKEVK